MNKIFKFSFVICALFLFVQSQYAQVGIRAGLNISSLSIEEEGTSVSFDNKIGAHFGVEYEKAINESFFFRPAALFSMKGSKFTDAFLGGEETITVSLNYLEVPLDFVYKVPAGTNMLGLSAGPYIGYLLSANVSDGDESESIKDDFTAIDFGFNIGLTYELPQFKIGVNFGASIGNIADSEEDDDATASNSNLSVFAVYRL